MNSQAPQPTFPVTMATLIAYAALAVLRWTDLTFEGLDQPLGQFLHERGTLHGTAVASGEPWRLLTSAYLHGGLLHVGFNAFALFRLGPPLEHALGSVRFALLYLVSALSGSLLCVLWNGPFAFAVGGSGALFGMLGALVALNMRLGRDPLEFFRTQGGRHLIAMIAAYLVIGALLEFISNTSHIGGLLGGFAITFFFLETGRSPIDGLGQWTRAALVALLCTVTAWSIAPVTRWDDLTRRWMNAEPGTERRRDLGLALMRSLHDAGMTVGPDTRPDEIWPPLLEDAVRERTKWLARAGL